MAITGINRTKLINYLNEYCFASIWNSIFKESRSNSKLTLYQPKSQTNVFYTDYGAYELPTKDAYFVYLYDTYLNREIADFDPGQWVRTDDLLNDSQTYFDVYDANGFIIPKGQVYLYTPSMGSQTFLVVKKKAMVACLPGGISSDLYLGVFRNPSYSANVSCVSVALSQSSTKADIVSAWQKTQLSNANIVYINGQFSLNKPNIDVTSSVSSDLYYDLIVDQDVQISFTVDVDDNNTGYQSTLYSGYREILHCPKVLNPNNLILTNDSATLFTINPLTGKGLLVNRQSSTTVSQITHNDLSISRDVLNAQKSALKASNVSVVVLQRFQNEYHTLMEDASFMKDMYLSDDATIISLLRGNVAANLSFWAAATLETSGYVSLMFTNSDTLDDSRLGDYVSALGYYGVAAILGSNIATGPYTGATAIITLPYSLVGKTPYPLVYYNGRKVVSQYVSTNTYDDATYGVSIDSDQYIPPNSTLTVCTLEYGDYHPTQVTPTDSLAAFTIDFSDFEVYAISDLIDSVVTYDRVLNKGYKLVNPGKATYSSVDNGDGTITITFVPSMFGVSYLIQPTNYVHLISTDIDPTLDEAGAVIVNLVSNIVGDTKTLVPALGWSSMEVYLNGFYLIKDVDYTATPCSAIDGTIYGIDVVLTNKSYLDFSTIVNTLEVILHGGTDVYNDSSYVIENRIKHRVTPTTWYPQISRTFINGVIDHNVVDEGMWMAVDDSVSNGAATATRTVIPKSVQNVLDEFTPADTTSQLAIIDNFLQRYIPDDPAVIKVTSVHSVFSPYITAIAHDMIRQGTSIVDDPDDVAFLKQFSAYSYLFDRDPTLTANGLIDRSYVAINSLYKDVSVSSPVMLRLLRRLISLTLIPSGAGVNVLGGAKI